MTQGKTNEEIQIEIDQLKTKISELEKSKIQNKTCIDNAPITDKDANYDGEIAGDINITGRKQTEKKIHNSNIDFLAKTAMQFVEFPQNKDLYYFVGEQVKKITGRDSYIVVNSVDPGTRFSTVHSIHGAGKLIDIISNKVGVNPIGMKIEAEDPNIRCKDGKLHIYKKGLYGLLVKTVPKSICKSIEVLAGVKEICVIDLTKRGQFFGNVVIFLKEKTDEIKNKLLIETFIKQASIAILKRQAEEALQINEGELNLIINSSPIGICTTDSIGNFITTNPAYEKMVGYTKKELMGLSFFDVTHPNDRPKNKKLFQDMFSMKTKNFSIEKRYIRKNGEEINVSINAVTIKDAEGNIRFGIAFSEDITDRKKAENTLRNTNARHTAMIKNISDVISIVGIDGISKYQSPNFEKLFGWKTKDLLGKNNFDKIHPDDIKRIQIEFSKMLKKETVSKVEFRYKCKNGTYKWVELFAINRINDPAINGVLLNFHDITERKQADEKLFESIEQLNLALEGANAGLWSWNIKTGEDLFDERWCAILGYTKDEIKQHISTWGKLMHPDDKDKVMDAINKHFENKNIEFKQEYRMKCKNGKWKWVFAVGKIVKIDVYGKPVQMTGILTDIDKQKQATEKIRTAEENLRNTFNISPNIISKANFNTGYFIEISQAVTRILGYSIEEFISKPFIEFVHPDDRKQTTDKISEEIKGKDVTFFENRYLCKNGSYKWLAWNSTKADDNGIVTAVASDISERKIAETDVRKLSTAVQQSPAMLVITDTKGKIEYVNPMFSEVTGYSSSEVIGQKSNILKPGEQKDSFYKNTWETIISGEIWRGQFHNKKKNGELFWESASVSAILNKAGEIINFIKIGEDITQQKINETKLQKALEKALESDRLKSAFLANMSHEIRTPMNGILGFTELLQDTDVSIENQKYFIEIIKKSCDRLLNTVNDIIEISQIESGEMKKSVNEINFLNHLKTLVTFFTPEIKKKGLKISIDNEIIGFDTVIRSDKNKLSSIFSNLIKNSIKYTNEGFIKVGFKLNEGQLIFYCKDSGIGIPKNRQKAIFNRFEQADIEDKQAHQGSGLGLAIVKSYVEMLDGKIWVESEEGKGSIFYVALPYNPIKTKQNDLSLKR